MPLGPGDRLERYLVLSLLGHGGMGEVYLAEDTRLRRRVALKVLRSADGAPGSDGDGAARLVREAQAAATLDHPNAVRVHDVGEEDGVAYMAMELVEGRPLRAFVGGASVDVATRRRWLCDVARARVRERLMRSTEAFTLEGARRPRSRAREAAA